MTCRELIEFLADYLEGELPADQRGLFDHHLAICPDCVVYLRTYRESIKLCKSAHTVEAERIYTSAPQELIDAILASQRGKPTESDS